MDADKVDVEEDYRYGGQYIITKIRHQVTDEVYTMILECAKDSVANPVVIGEPNYKASSERPELYDLYDNEGAPPL